MDGRTTLVEVEASLFGGVRGRRLGGHHSCVVVQHLSAADDSVGHEDRIALVISPRVGGVGPFPVLTDLSCLP